MKKALVLVLGVCLVALLIGSVAARDAVNTQKKLMKDEGSLSNLPEVADPGLRGLYEQAAVDTYYIVWYNFEPPVGLTGWEQRDNTEQRAAYSHVDDFVGLSGGCFATLYPLEGAQSMWCGVRKDTLDKYTCSWLSDFGYGNGWNQLLQTAPFYFHGRITWSGILRYDTEDGYDFTRLEYDSGNNNWVELAKLASWGDTNYVFEIETPQVATKLRYRFTADGAVSNEDYDCAFDGAFITDAITVADNDSVIWYADFESLAPAPPGTKKWVAEVGDTTDGFWWGKRGVPYGKFSGLLNGLADKDPCADNFGSQVVFFVGSPVPSASYPGLYDTPFCTGPGRKLQPCQDEMIISPVIKMTKYSTLKNSVQDADIPGGDLPLLGGTSLRFTVYRDLPSENCVYYVWHVRTIDPVSGCPSIWYDMNYVYYGPDKDYIFTTQDVSKWIATNNDVQIALGALDYCYAWGTTSCKCVSHTPSPWIDQARLVRYKTSGPQYTFRGLEFFQDNFPVEPYHLESYVRADCAQDVRLAADPLLTPGDSMVVSCASPLAGGLAFDPAGGPAVYLHVMASYIGKDTTGVYYDGLQLEGTYGTYKGPSTVLHWNIIQCDSAFYQGYPGPDLYAVDLNDSLFTRGWMIEYYFTAVDLNGIERALPWWARSAGPYFEFTCLPTKNSDVLFVDDFEGRGSWNGSVDDYWRSVFSAVLADTNQPDRYDVNSPSSGVDNGPGSRAKNPHLTGSGMGDWEGYDKIIWDSGDLESFTISDGTDDKSNDVDMLINWMDQSQHRCGLWVCGDDIAFGLKTLNHANGLALMQTWCGMDLETGGTSYFEITGGRTGGGIITPLVTGDVDLNLFVHAGVPDKWFAYGGCPIINELDVLKKTGTGKLAATYPIYNSIVRPAAVGNSQLNGGGYAVRTMWFGFSYQLVRDDVRTSPQDRFHIAKDVFDWMQNLTQSDVSQGDVPAARNKLAQNYPNPFNPSTRIDYQMKEKGFVTLKIYNVAGQLVRTLENGVKDAGLQHSLWNGKNNQGNAVASGIYFYKMETKNFSQTKKMVMLR